MAERLNRTKTTHINLRVDAEIKVMAVRAAADRRSLTAYIEKLIEDDVAKGQRSTFRAR
jgi:predicted HicB family RNase H-like nuclease